VADRLYRCGRAALFGLALLVNLAAAALLVAVLVYDVWMGLR
jgi:hypothetical protein